MILGQQPLLGLRLVLDALLVVLPYLGHGELQGRDSMLFKIIMKIIMKILSKCYKKMVTQKTGQNLSRTGKLEVVPYIMFRILLELVSILGLADRSGNPAFECIELHPLSLQRGHKTSESSGCCASLM